MIPIARQSSETLLETVGSHLYVRELGSGRPIVVLHGGPDFDHEYLLPDLDRLADLGRLVYYDQRGRGRSFSGETPDDVTIESEMADLDHVRAWTGSPSVALIGHSWGTVLALEYALRHQERVSHLILLNAAPATHADFLAFREHLGRNRSPERRDRMAALSTDPAYLAGDTAKDAEYHRLHFATALSRPERLEGIIRRLRRGFTAESIVAARAIEDGLYDQTWRRKDFDLLARLPDLDVPTLLLHGDRDLIPISVARHIEEAIPESRLVVLPDCGHFAFLEQPESVHVAIAGHLS